MIDRDALVDQQWYDGFVWHNGVQKNVLTLKWIESMELFCDTKFQPDVHLQLHDSEGPHHYNFEPNTLSEEPI